mmetsp:Transcript_5324/g.15171  ORF Transcript_5324/g.15171 Transcript_5324/m.15171 type:complete len:384 (-) Transcript_5324:528-1679(-)
MQSTKGWRVSAALPQQRQCEVRERAGLLQHGHGVHCHTENLVVAFSRNDRSSQDAELLTAEFEHQRSPRWAATSVVDNAAELPVDPAQGAKVLPPIVHALAALQGRQSSVFILRRELSTSPVEDFHEDARALAETANLQRYRQGRPDPHLRCRQPLEGNQQPPHGCQCGPRGTVSVHLRARTKRGDVEESCEELVRVKPLKSKTFRGLAAHESSPHPAHRGMTVHHGLDALLQCAGRELHPLKAHAFGHRIRPRVELVVLPRMKSGFSLPTRDGGLRAHLHVTQSHAVEAIPQILEQQQRSDLGGLGFQVRHAGEARDAMATYRHTSERLPLHVVIRHHLELAIKVELVHGMREVLAYEVATVRTWWLTSRLISDAEEEGGAA